MPSATKIAGDDPAQVLQSMWFDRIRGPIGTAATRWINGMSSFVDDCHRPVGECGVDADNGGDVDGGVGAVDEESVPAAYR